MIMPLGDISPIGLTQAAQPPAIPDTTIYWDEDWVVDSNAFYLNQTIIVSGNITVMPGFSLTLINVTIMMNCTKSNGQYRINVTSGGALHIYDYDWDNTTTKDASVIQDSPKDKDDGSNMDYVFSFYAWAGATLEVRNSYIRDCGWDAPAFEDKGIFVEADGAVFDHVDISGQFIGLIFVDSSNSLVDNCSFNISGASDFSCAIYTWNSPDIVILNNVFNIRTTLNDDIALFIRRSPGTIIIGNRVYIDGTQGWNYGLYFEDSVDYTVAYNNIYLNAQGVGLHFQQMNRCIVIGNNIYSYVDNCCGVDAFNLNDSLVYWNNIDMNGWGTGVYLQGWFNNTAFNQLTITGTADFIDAIFLGGAHWATFTNISIDLNGIGCYGFSAIYSENITVSGITANLAHTDGAGIVFYDGTKKCWFDSAQITTTANIPALVGINCSDVFIVNSTLNAPTMFDIEMRKNATVILLNVTFSDADVTETFTRLIVMWYLHIQVLNDTGYPFPGVNVSVIQAGGKEVRTEKTGDDGWLNWTACIGYLLTESGRDNSTNPHVVLAHNATCWDGKYVDLSNGGQTINITFANDDPVITDPVSDIQVQEDSDYNKTFHATDKESNPLIWSINTSESWIYITTYPGMGKLTITPTDDDVGTHLYTIRVTDINGGYDEFSVTVNITNRPPEILTIDITTATEDSTYSVDYDSDDDTSTYWSIVSSPSWLTMDNVTGMLSGTPDNSHVGDSIVNISVEDGNGGITFREFTLNVNNTPLTITSPDTYTAPEDIEYRKNYQSSDDGQGTITWSLYTDAEWLSIDPETGILNGTPTNEHVGEWTVNVSVDDGNGGMDFTNFTLTVINAAPQILTEDIPWADEDMVYSVNYDSSDDWQGTINWSLVTNATWLSINSTTGVISGTPRNEHIGSYWINITVDDGNEGLGSHNFTVVVNNTNDEPIITTQDVLSATEDQLYSVDYEANDDDSDTLTWSLDTSAGWLSINPDTGELTGTPATHQDAGDWEITITCDDGHGGIDSHTFTVNVASVNDAPVISHYLPTDTYPSVEEGDALDFNITYSDEEGDSITITWMLDSQVVREDVPFWSYEPDFGTAGDHEVLVNITDDGGASIQQRWIVIVTQANHPPVIGEFEPMNLKPVMKPGESSMTFGVNASDPDGDQLTYQWFLNGNDTGERTSSFTLDRSLCDPGTYNLTVLVTDENDTITMQEWSVDVKAATSDDPEPFSIFLIFAIVIAVVLLLIIALFIWKKKESNIEDIFLVSNNGLLLAHRSRELRPEMDDDILSSMLTAVQDFVKDSFKDKSKFGLKRLDFGDSVIHIKRGKYIYMAVVLSGKEPADLDESLDKVVTNMEAKYDNALKDWDGNMEQVRGLKDLLDNMLK
jgi:hypothetical protein